MPQSMENTDLDVVVIGAGAAGIAAGLRLAAAPMKFLILEARERLGGRAWTQMIGGHPQDLGCGWLHSADRNPWRSRFVEAGFTIDKTSPGWGEQSLDLGFSPEDQAEFGLAWDTFHQKLAASAARQDRDLPASVLLDSTGRFNALLDAISTYVSGAELARISLIDAATYDDSGINWRVVEGYGAAIAAQAELAAGRPLPVKLKCHVARIDHNGPALRVETSTGTLTCRFVIVTVPPNLLLIDQPAFDPPLAEKSNAAAGLPLGLADKLLLRVEDADVLPKDGHLFGRTDRVATASYHLRPFGRGLIEAYFGGELARRLESEGETAFFAFACDELAGLFGNDIRQRLSPLAHTAWGKDPYARGSYSFAAPGRARARAKLLEPVDNRIFFAGEACSQRDFSTAHGAYLTGIAAADAVLELLRGR